MFRNKEAFKTQHSFSFSPSSGRVLPLATAKERLVNTWHSLTWPVTKKILKANLAVIIALGLMFYPPIMNKTGVSTALAPVAVEFILPSKSLGFVAEDAIFGAFMCTVSAAYSILGTYCASLVRDPSSDVLAQPALCGILLSFLILGAFVLNYVRAKVQQANVGGMLSALIMVLSLTGSVLDRQWTPIHVIYVLLSALTGFATIFVVYFFISPENSTTAYIQELVNVLETFDEITRQQVKAFFHSQHQNLLDKDSRHNPDSPAVVHNKTDSLLTSLIDKKRMARREISFNTISPVDVNEMTKIVKRLRIPLQGIAIAHTMDSNMRKMELLQRAEEMLQKHYDQPRESVTTTSPVFVFTPPSQGPSSRVQPSEQQYTENPSDSHVNEGSTICNNVSVVKDEAAKSGIELSSASAVHLPGENRNLSPLFITEKGSILIHRSSSHENGSYSSNHSGNSTDSTGARVGEAYGHHRHDSGESSTARLSVTLDENVCKYNKLREEYNAILREGRPIYIDLMSACSVAIVETIKRLRRMQNIDPRYQDKPFFYKYILGKGGPNTAILYDQYRDPSVVLLAAIQRFDTHRLTGLPKLYNDRHQPRRSLLLILKFQFSLRTYAETLYTLSSLVFEMDRVRSRRRLWLPSISIRKFFWKQRETSYDLDSPSGLAHQASNSNMQRTLTQHTVLIQSMVGIPHSPEKQDGLPLIPEFNNRDDEKCFDLESQRPTSKKKSCTDTDISDHDNYDDDATDDDDATTSTSFSTTCPNLRYQSPNNNGTSFYQLTSQLSNPARGRVVCPQVNSTWFHEHQKRPSRRRKRLRRLQRKRHRQNDGEGQGENDNADDAYDDDDRRQQRKDYANMFHRLMVWRHQINQQPATVSPPVLVDPSSYHDPDASYPTTTSQRFFYAIWSFGRQYIYTRDTAFALRASILVTVLTIPGFLEQSLYWYNTARGQWATVVALIWMGPSVGSSFFGTMVRTVGTLVGAAVGLLIWEISQGRVWALLLVTFIFNLPFYVLYTLSVFWRATGLFCLITMSLIIGYGYVYMSTGVPISVYQVTYQRIASVLIGVTSAMIVSVLPYAHTSRVQVRHRISHILGDVGVLYASLLGTLLKGSRYEHRIKETNQKLFRIFANTIRQQIQVTRALLDQSRFEPALRGVFPEKKYLKLLQVLDTMLNLMLQMELSLEKVDTRWRMNLVNQTWVERKNMIASFLTALQLASSALMNKTPLPPYILQPTKARRTLTDKVRQLAPFAVERLGDPEYTYYSTYLMNSEQLAVEIEVLVATVRELVGSDSVSVMLDGIR